MLNCDQVRKCISDYSVGALDEKTASAVEAHLASCPGCARELRVLEASLELVESMPEIDPPAGMWNAVYQQISVQETSFADRIRASFFPPVRALAAGFALLIVVVALTFSRINTPAPTVAADMSTSEYVQGHAFFASQDAFADRYGLASVAGAAIPTGETQVQ